MLPFSNKYGSQDIAEILLKVIELLNYWHLTPTLAVFQIYCGILSEKSEVKYTCVSNLYRL